MGRQAFRGVDHPPADDAHPVLRAFHDLWRREQTGMPPSWRHRAHTHWRDYFLIHLTETRYRATGTAPTPHQRLRDRRHSIGCRPTYDMAERLGHFTVPGASYDTHPVQDLDTLMVDVVVLHNEIVSFDKELAQGEENYITAIARTRRLSQDEAIRHTLEELDTTFKRWIAHREAIPGLHAVLGLTADEIENTDRYLEDALLACYSGTLNWSYATARYATEPLEG